MAAKTIRLRYPATCALCGIALPPSTRASWDSGARTATCLDCAAGTHSDFTPAPAPAAPIPEPQPHPLAIGNAGASAQQQHDTLQQRREANIDRRWGRLAGVVRFLSDDPQSMKAWAKGSEGERRLAESLTKRVGDRAVLLHDRKVPKTRGNIDHLAIAASGVWVIDAKKYTGLVERRDKGGWFKTDHHLYVGRRDRTKLADGLAWQIAAVGAALGDTDIPITPALCFIDAEWRLFAKPFQLNGVWVTWGKTLADMIAAPGSLNQTDVMRVAGRLATALPPVIPTS